MGDFTPARPDIVRRLNAMAAGVGGARAIVPLDADELIGLAVAATGLDDFGEPDWEEPYRRLVAALDTDARLNVVGRLMCRHDALRHLCARLTVLDAHRRDPALAATAVPAPVFITGPARSGTSILQELLALDPNLRAPLAYEMAHPVVAADVDDDTRASWAECEFDLWGDVDPGFRAVHDLDARLPEECLWLMAPQFDLGFWSTNVDMPGLDGVPGVHRPDARLRLPQALRAGAPGRHAHHVAVQVTGAPEPPRAADRRLPRRPHHPHPPRPGEDGGVDREHARPRPLHPLRRGRHPLDRGVVGVRAHR